MTSSLTDSELLATQQEARSFISDCKEIIDQGMNDLIFPSVPRGLYDPMRYALSHEGKRIRPLVTLLSYGLFQSDVRQILRPALALEMFHNFTLLHDDVMDKAPLRRGKPSVYARWGTPVAVLAGDATLIEGYKLLCELPSFALAKVLQMFNQSAIHVCEGQQMDIDFESQAHVTEDDYLEMIRLKTGCLLGFCFVLGATRAKACSEEVQLLDTLGQHIGMIFQLRDDYLDVYGSKETFGKRAGGDILSNKKTFLLIKALQRAQKQPKKELNYWIQAKEFEEEEKIRAVTALYDQLLIPQEVRTKIETLRTECYASIDQLQAPVSRKEAIKSLLDQLSVRAK